VGLHLEEEGIIQEVLDWLHIVQLIKESVYVDPFELISIEVVIDDCLIRAFIGLSSVQAFISLNFKVIEYTRVEITF
jgi:hypothetical protein